MRIVVHIACVLVGCLSLSGCATSLETNSESTAVPHHAQPLAVLPPGSTWGYMLDSIASSDEMRCVEQIPHVDALLKLEISDGSIQGTIWPIWVSTLLTIEIGDERWPHELWRCLSPQTTGAVFVTTSLEEMRLANMSLTPSLFGCVMRLHENPGFAQDVSTYFQQPHTFSNADSVGDDVLVLDTFWEPLDAPILPYFEACIAIEQ